jgi:hypothetical protein
VAVEGRDMMANGNDEKLRLKPMDGHDDGLSILENTFLLIPICALVDVL